jgi:hypothetical protein
MRFLLPTLMNFTAYSEKIFPTPFRYPRLGDKIPPYSSYLSGEEEKVSGFGERTLPGLCPLAITERKIVRVISVVQLPEEFDVDDKE